MVYLKKYLSFFKRLLLTFIFSKKLKYLRFFCGGWKGRYKFSFSERWLGAKICVYGYDSGVTERTIFSDNNFDLIKVDKVNLFTKKVFKPGELTYLYKETFLPFRKNPHSYETDFIKIEKDDVVIDAGACEGFFSFLALRNKASKIYLFEPFDDFKKGLEKTFSKEIVENKVEVINMALSKVSGKVSFDIDKEYLCAAALCEYGKVQVRTTSLDEFVSQNNFDRIDFIKMDIEGSEIDAIKGAEETIKKFRPKLSIAVYHEYENAEKIKKLLSDFNVGYKIRFGGCYMFEKPYRPFMLYAYIK